MSSQRKCVLIVDVDTDLLISMEHLLENEGFETTTTWDMHEALALLGSRDVDLLLVGQHPPEVSSEHLLRELRSGRKRVPCVVMQSGPQHPFEGAYLCSLGADAVVPKSGSVQESDEVGILCGFLESDEFSLGRGPRLHVQEKWAEFPVSLWK